MLAEGGGKGRGRGGGGVPGAFLFTGGQVRGLRGWEKGRRARGSRGLSGSDSLVDYAEL